MTFKQAVENTPGLNGAYRSGLQAVKGVDRPHIDAEDTRRLTGSVDLDSALKADHPRDPVWDYAIGHKPTNLKVEMVYWVEIHPASDGEVNTVLAKLQWLKQWLRATAQALNYMRREFIWVSSGKTSFTLTSPQQKRFAQLGLQHKGRVLKILDQAAA